GATWIPWSVLPSGVSRLTGTAARGRGPAGPTAWVGKMSWVCRVDIMTMTAIRTASATRSALTSSPLPRQRGLEGGRHPCNREWPLDQSDAGELARRRVDMAATGEHERDPALAKLGRNGPNILALQID